jgi:hypothetical protein
MHELIRFRDGRSEQNYGVYHDRYRRTASGWRFTERIYEVRFLDHSRLAGSLRRIAAARRRSTPRGRCDRNLPGHPHAMAGS